MFQNSYQNGTYFDVFDPKGSFSLIKPLKIKSKPSTS